MTEKISESIKNEIDNITPASIPEPIAESTEKKDSSKPLQGQPVRPAPQIKNTQIKDPNKRPAFMTPFIYFINLFSVLFIIFSIIWICMPGQIEYSIASSYATGYILPKNEEKANRLFQAAAIRGHDLAQNNIASFYGNKSSSDYNPKLALYWITKAARKNSPEALTNLGTFYYNGVGLPSNKEKAFEYYLKAAKQNYELAQYLVGRSYFYGLGVTENKDEAKKWLTLATRQGNQEAKELLK